MNTCTLFTVVFNNTKSHQKELSFPYTCCAMYAVSELSVFKNEKLLALDWRAVLGNNALYAFQLQKSLHYFLGYCSSLHNMLCPLLHILSTITSLLSTLSPHYTSSPSAQVGLFSCPMLCRLDSLLLLNCCCRLQSGFKMNVASCFPALIISPLFWQCVWFFYFFRFAFHAAASWWWWSSFSGKCFTADPDSSLSKRVLKILWRCSQKFSLLKCRWKGRNSVVSHFGGLYCRFHFAKTGPDVSDNIVHIHANCSPVDLVIERYALCISC